LSTWNGFGSAFRGFSRKRRDGTHYATEWVLVAGMPIAPVMRYRLTIGGTETTYISNTIHTSKKYAVHEDDLPLRLKEVLLTYPTWWIIGPLITIGPLVLIAFMLSLSGTRNSFAIGIYLLFSIVWLCAGPAIFSWRCNKYRGIS
jgi:hypothetical protein